MEENPLLEDTMTNRTRTRRAQKRQSQQIDEAIRVQRTAAHHAVAKLAAAAVHLEMISYVASHGARMSGYTMDELRELSYDLDPAERAVVYTYLEAVERAWAGIDR